MLLQLAVVLTATCGTITPAGWYTPPAAGSCQVVATSGALRSVAAITLLVPPPTIAGVPFGPSQMYAGCSLPDPRPFTMVKAGVTATNIGCTLVLARHDGIKLLVHPVAGQHANYLTNGAFDRSKWDGELATYGPVQVGLIAQAYRDGVIRALVVMDEPFNQGVGDGNAGNTWGTRPLTKALVDSLCGDLKAKWPGIPVGAIHDADDFDPTHLYRVCDTRIPQYRWTKTRGDIPAFITAELAMASREQMQGIVFSLNLLHGGRPTTPCESGISYDGKCAMSAANVMAWGAALGAKGCALMEWRYEASYTGRPEIVAAHQWLADSLAKVAAKPCGRL